MKRLFVNLSNRSFYPEKMDDRTCDSNQLLNTVNQFYYINRFLSNSRKFIKQYIIKDMEKDKLKQYIFLELGAGGCDIAIWLNSYCKRKKISLKIYCLDNDPRIIGYATQKCMGINAISIIHDDICNIDSLPVRPDYVFCNHLIHHLSDTQVTGFFWRLTSITRRIALINDIVRSPIAYFLYYLMSNLFFRNSYAIHDGCLSIRKSFTLNELKVFIESLKIPFSFSIYRKFPFRLLLVLDKKIE
ncbi:MAG: methyltransferase domain-containing protein [Chitinispirillia bacterium]|jgi:2-polyprenyl-3-methyl-5-hydroxy-6-metoxy-1,4-benzoquinol methylase